MARALPLPLETVLLDVDGTILDTREFILAAFEHAFREQGLPPPPRDDLARFVGMKQLEVIYGGFAGSRAAAMAAAHRDFQRANLALAVPFPGAAETLAQLRGAGLALGAVTSRSRRTSTASLAQHGFDRFFSAVISAEDVSRLKPDPEPLAAALALLGRGAAGAVMIGDAPADIEAGKAAGMFTVAATYGFHGPAVLSSGPDASIGAIAELPAALGVAPAGP